jgi:hypothetical protein
VKRLAFPLLGIVLTCAFVAPIFALPVWTFSSTSDGSVADTDGGFILTGPNFPGGQNNTASYTAVADTDFTYSALWHYTTTDSPFFDRPYFVLNGMQTLLVTPDLGNDVQGSIQIELHAGDVYGWQINAIDSCCGAGYLTITDPTYVVASPSPSAEPSESPTPEASPTPSETPTPSPEETQTPSPEPTPSIQPSPSEVPSVQPSPTPTPTPKPSPTPIPSPVPSPTESASPSADPVPSDTPTLEPSVAPSPEPSASPDTISEQVDAAVAAVGEAVSAAIGKIANLGKDLSPEEKKKAAPVAVAIVISQVASAAVAAASSAAAAARKGD